MRRLAENPRLPASSVEFAARVAALTPVQREEAITAFERLSEDDRLLIAARYHLGMSAADAATASGIPEALTGLRLRQAVRRLRSRLGRRRMTTTSRSDRGRQRGRLPRACARRPTTTSGSLVMATVVSELRRVPDVAPRVIDRLVRDATAYPELLGAAASPTMPPWRARRPARITSSAKNDDDADQSTKTSQPTSDECELSQARRHAEPTTPRAQTRVTS